MKTLLMASTILGVISPVPVTAQHGYTLMCNRQEIQNNYIDAGGGFVYPINLEGTDGKPVHSGVSFINCVSTETSELNIYTEDRLCNLMLEVKESHQEWNIPISFTLTINGTPVEDYNILVHVRPQVSL